MKLILTAALMMISTMSYASNVAVIDMEKVVQSSPEGKAVKKKIEAAYAANKAQFQKKEKVLQEEAKSYESQKQKLSPQQQMTKERELGMRMSEFEKDLQESEKKIEEMSEKMSEPLLKKVQGIVADISKAKGYTVVLEKSSSQVFWANDNADISDQVIKVLSR